MNDSISIKLKQFLEERRINSKDPLTKETRIETDLDITGTDAIQLILEYGKHFNVNVSEFLAAEYFEAEGSFPWFNFNKKRNKKTLTISHLEKGIRAGRLDEEIINS
ncbi:MAG TPA: DUF1493 family protein [Bacteroidia bacterium]|jgi:acyl carrier protein|nr:DUF1493 family protein [Bacteroidia bacterium]